MVRCETTVSDTGVSWHPELAPSGYSSYGFRRRIGEFSWGQATDRSFICSRAYCNDIPRATRGCRRQSLVVQDEVTEAVEYARNNFSIETEQYHKVWYKLYVSPDATKRSNVLVLCELCFSLLLSNGSVEWMFKLVKTDRRTRLHQDTLGDLLEIQLEGPSLGRFSPKQAVEAWWKDCKTVRRPNQGPHKEYASWQAHQVGTSTSAVEQESEGELPFVFRCLNGMEWVWWHWLDWQRHLWQLNSVTVRSSNPVLY